MDRYALVAAVGMLCIGTPGTSGAQRIAPRSQTFWIAGGLTIVGATPFDERIRALAARHQSPALDRVARPIGDAGGTRYVLPVLIGGVVIPRLAGNRSLSTSVVDISLGYAVADGAGILLRPIIGRHRPDATGRPARFASMRREHEWHSFPSGHVLRAMSLATGVAIKAHRPWASSVAYGLATVMGLQRIYTQQHWLSDVVAGTVLGVAASATTVHWRERQRGER